MDLDTGAGVTIISKTSWMSTFPTVSIEKSDIRFTTTYTKEPLSVSGQKEVEVQYENQKKNLIITIVEGNGPNLLGRDWLQHLHINWSEVSNVRV